MTSKRDPRLFVADLGEVRLLIYLFYLCGHANTTTKVPNETNNCPHTLYRSKFAAASRGFPATARLSCTK